MKIPCFMIILYAAFTFIIHPRLVLSFRPRSTVSRRCHAQNNDRTYFVIRSSSRCHNNIESFDDETPHRDSIYRRKFFAQVSTTITLLTFAPSFAKAQGLVLFPCTTPLSNIYHVMRAGQTLLEEEDILTTNPMFLTNREAALSEKGIAQVEDACRILERNQINPSVIKYSLAASAMDTTRIVKDELKVGQNRIIPEFTFMDPRGIGQWDMMSYAQTLPAIVALDEAEAGKQGKAGRPPPNEDGTPNETLADQYIRLVQLMSGTF
jgi:broad specificity phosphatase PhoE